MARGGATASGAPSIPVTRFLIGPPFNIGAWPRLSPDGTELAFGTLVEGRSRFWIRTLDSLDGRALTNTTATETPFWSPDGRVLAFFADQKLKRIQMNAEDPETITDAPPSPGRRLVRRLDPVCDDDRDLAGGGR